MLDFTSAIQRESLRLQSAAHLGLPKGMGTVRFACHAPCTAAEVVEKAKAVLRVINERSLGSGPSDADWGRLLPSWFVERCEPVKSEAESQAWLAWWRGLSDDQMADVERNQAWTLDGWLYSLTPDQRRWFWWDAVPLTEHNFVVAVEAHEWPFPSGALGWLLRASGADRVEAEV